MLIITHDRDVLGRVDRIIELKDGRAVSYRGNYDAYLKQNAQATAAGMNNFEQVEKRMTNLRQKVLDYQRLKEKSRNPGTIQKFKRLENEARAELAELSEMDKPTFWIDKQSAEQLDYKSAERYGKFKARNIRLSMKDAASRSQHVLVRVEDAAVGVGERILFEGVNIDLREGEAVELRGRNGAGKTTLIRMLLGQRRGSDSSLSDKSIALRTALPDAFDLEETAGRRTAAATPPSSARAHSSLKSPLEILCERSAETSATRERFTVSGGGGVAAAAPILYSGNFFLDPQVRVGVYEQEIDERYLADPLEVAIEKLYLSRDLPISETKIRQLLADYLFTEADRMTPLAHLSGGQKARFQIIAMLANDPQLLILDEPTNHLDLPSIEELETALVKYSGAILYVSHDNYFRQAIGGEVVQIGAE